MNKEGFELWGQLPIEIQKQFDLGAKTIELKRGDFIYKTGDRPQGIYFVKSGLIGLVLLGASSGKQHLMRFFKEGQFLGHRSLFSDEVYHGEALVIEPTVIKLVSKELIFSAIEKYPQILFNVVKVLSKELRRCELNQIRILENQILPRVCQSLVYLKDLKPEHNWTRQEIADFCASTVSTVIKTLAQIEEMGLIRQTGRSIEIIDRKRLISIQDDL